MNPGPAPARTRRPRFRIWMMMVALPAIALSLVYWAGIDPFRRNPYWAALDEAKRWCASGDDSFQAKWHYDWSKPEPAYIEDEPSSARVPCLVKIHYVWKIHDDGCSMSRFALSRDGRLKQEHDIYNWAIQGGQGTRTPAEMLALKTLIAALPASQGWIPIGNAVSVGFLDRGAWSTRVYDNARLPPEVAALLQAIDPRQ